MADIYVSTTGNDATGDGTAGNPYATPGKAASVFASGDRIRIIAPGTYSVDMTATANTAGGRIDLTMGEGGDNNRIVGDGGIPILQASNNAAAYVVALTGNHGRVEGIRVDVNGQASVSGIVTGTNGLTTGCEVINLAGGVGISGNRAVDCKISGTSGTGCNAGTQVSCEADGLTTGLLLEGDSVQASGCVAANCGTGVILTSGGNADHMTVYNSTVGFLLSNGNRSKLLLRCLLVSCNTGISGDGAAHRVKDCAFYNCSTKYGTLNATGDIDLSADPLEDGAGGDYRPNATAGGGAAVRGFAATVPGSATTSYRDIGAVQHQDSGGGGTAGPKLPVGWLRGIA